MSTLEFDLLSLLLAFSFVEPSIDWRFEFDEHSYW